MLSLYVLAERTKALWRSAYALACGVKRIMHWHARYMEVLSSALPALAWHGLRTADLFDG